MHVPGNGHPVAWADRAQRLAIGVSAWFGHSISVSLLLCPLDQRRAPFGPCRCAPSVGGNATMKARFDTRSALARSASGGRRYSRRLFIAPPPPTIWRMGATPGGG
jgi:hypothetical protein